MKKLALLFVIMGSVLALAQTAPQFSVLSDTLQAQIGEPIELTLRARIKKGASLKWPAVQDSLSLTVLDSSQKEYQRLDEDELRLQKWRVTRYDSGYYFLQLPFIYEGDTLFSNRLALHFSFPPIDENADFYDIQGPLAVPPDYWRIAAFVLAGLLLLAGVYGLWKWRRGRETQADAPLADPRTPAQKALDALHALEQAKLWQKGEIKNYYSQLVDILRLYLEQQWGIKAMESTADELVQKLEALAAPGVSEELQKNLADMLHTSALVKFAKTSPAGNENEQALGLVREFVQAEPKPINDNDGV